MNETIEAITEQLKAGPKTMIELYEVLPDRKRTIAAALVEMAREDKIEWVGEKKLIRLVATPDPVVVLARGSRTTTTAPRE